MIDSKKRTFLKAITWKIIGFIVLSFLTFAATGSIAAATTISILYHAIQFVTYMLHEYIWKYISFGRTHGLFIQMTGLSGAGKTTLATTVAKNLRRQGIQVEIIDGDEYRAGICGDLGFSKEDRNTNIRRLSFVGKVLSRNRVVAIMSAINPYDEIRQEIKGNLKHSKLVYVECPTGVVIDRDTKGLYAKALLPDGHPDKIHNFTGISDPFEVPEDADLVINTSSDSVEESVKKLEKFILENIS